MQRTLIVVALLVLVLLSLVAGSLAGHWPFWQRALAWHAAAPAWPEQLPGSAMLLEGAATAPRELPVDEALLPSVDALAGRHPTRALLTWRRDAGIARWTRLPEQPTVVAGHELTPLWLLPVLEHLLQRGDIAARALDEPLGAAFPEWKDDERAAITPRQLAQQLSGLAAARHRPMDPFSARTRLAAGPDAARAALATRMAYPPGSHWQPSPANAQLLALWLERRAAEALPSLMEQAVWRPWRLGEARFALDRPRGRPLVHCCSRMAAEDWLELARWIAEDEGRGAAGIARGRLAGTLAATAPIAPEQGFLLQVKRDAAGGMLGLWQASPNALLYVDPLRGHAAVWFFEEPVPPGRVAGLRDALEALLSRTTSPL